MGVRSVARMREEMLRVRATMEKRRAAMSALQSVKESYKSGKRIKPELLSAAGGVGNRYGGAGIGGAQSKDVIETGQRGLSVRESMKFADGVQHDPEDEYGVTAGGLTRVLLTTSRGASKRLVAFCKEWEQVLDSPLRLPRGHLRREELVTLVQERGVQNVMLCQETQGNPSALVVSHFPAGPTLSLAIQGLTLRRDLEEKPPGVPSVPIKLAFEGFDTEIAKRVQKILAACFGTGETDAGARQSVTPKAKKQRVGLFVNKNGLIHFRHLLYGTDNVITELGPRFALQPFRVEQGTFATKNKVEWVLRPHNRSQKSLATKEVASG